MRALLTFALLCTIIITASAQKSDYKKLQKGGFPVELLQDLVSEYPDFVPGQLKLAEILERSDSEAALEQYQHVLPMITEAEVKSNSKYYEDYTQRDYRSGKMVITAENIRKEVEKRIKALSGGKK